VVDPEAGYDAEITGGGGDGGAGLSWSVHKGQWHSLPGNLEALTGLLTVSPLQNWEPIVLSLHPCSSTSQILIFESLALNRSLARQGLRQQVHQLVCLPSSEQQPLHVAKSLLLRSFHTRFITALRQQYGSGGKHELDALELGDLLSWVGSDYAEVPYPPIQCHTSVASCESRLLTDRIIDDSAVVQRLLACLSMDRG
jgi:hypothetical protein